VLFDPVCDLRELCVLHGDSVDEKALCGIGGDREPERAQLLARIRADERRGRRARRRLAADRLISLSEIGVADPFAEQRYRALVRPQACALGGEAATLMQGAVNRTGPGPFAAGSSPVYGVLRRPSPASGESIPF